MENKLKDAVEKGSWSDRRLIMYLMGLKGAPGMLFKDYGKEGSLRLNALINLVNKGLIKITYFQFGMMRVRGVVLIQLDRALK